jgi:hypothetical protein
MIAVDKTSAVIFERPGRREAAWLHCGRHGTRSKLQGGGKRRLPDRKHSADIIDRCAEYTEREAAANQGKQYDRFHAVDLLRVDVKFVSEVGHGTLALRIGKARDSTFPRQTILRSALAAVTDVTPQRPVAPR